MMKEIEQYSYDKFEKFPKIPRLTKDMQMIITEKMDGTNAQINISESPHSASPEDMILQAGSRNRWITPDKDNYGFARWCYDNRTELIKSLGLGRHFGEWCGPGIQKNKYGLKEKTLFLFNTLRWEHHPVVEEGLVRLVPVLYHGVLDTQKISEVMTDLWTVGSRVGEPGSVPEGIIVYLPKSRQLFKRTFEYEQGKWGAK